MLRKIAWGSYKSVHGTYENLISKGKDSHLKVLPPYQDSDYQQNSMFFSKLPPEIRRIIYEYVFASFPQKFISVVLLHHKRLNIPRYSRIDSNWAEDFGTIITLFLTCRRIYYETAPMLYSRGAFVFYDPAKVCHFFRAIIPRRLNDVQSLKIMWDGCASDTFFGKPHYRNKGLEWEMWADSWNIIAGMESLRELRVQMFNDKFLASPVRRRQVTQPMMSVKGLSFFELWLPSIEIGHWEFLEEPPFKLVTQFSCPV